MVELQGGPEARRESEADAISEELACSCEAAGRHLQAQLQGPLQSWLKNAHNAASFEHLSFRPRSQLFFERIEDCVGRQMPDGA